MLGSRIAAFCVLVALCLAVVTSSKSDLVAQTGPGTDPRQPGKAAKAFPELASGAWFDLSRGGEGLVIEATDDGSGLLYWFTYDNQGRQRWFLGSGRLSHDTLEIDDLLVSRGGRFGDQFDPDKIEYRRVGRARVSFVDCHSARFEYTVEGESGEQDLTRLTLPAGLQCEPGEEPTNHRGHGYSGSWFDLAHDGEGFVVQVVDDETAAVFWFTYRPNGRQAWLIGVGRVDGSRISVDPAQITRGGLFGADFSPDQVKLRRWGRLELDMTCETAAAQYVSRFDRFGEGAQDLVRLTGLAGVECPKPDNAPPPQRITGDIPVAFTSVNLVPMSDLGVKARQTVLVEDGRIAAMGDAGTVAIPPEAIRIDGRGRYLMPGLADMHTHVNRDDLSSYLAHGVTTVRNMWGFPDVKAMQSEIAAGDLEGPTIYSTSPGLDASPPRWPFTQIVDSPSQADAVVQRQKANGWGTLKLYQKLNRASYDAIIASARRHGLDYVGHTPTDVGLHRVLEAGQRSIEHLGGYERVLNGAGLRGPAGWVDVDRAGMGPLAAKTQAHGVWNCPTLAIQLNMGQNLPTADRDRGAGNRRRMVKALHDAGAGLLVGTDAGIGITAPGAAIHTELAEFHKAGLSPYEALLGATRNAAAFLGESGEFGVIETGARADLLLVDANPLLDLGALRHPVGVMVRGDWRAVNTQSEVP